MFQVRFHGRGGQGVVTAAEMLAVAAFLEGRYAQAFPSFGSERMGAPVVSFCRIDDREIRVREPVSEPNALIIQDPTLLQQVDVFAGLRRDGYILINSEHSFEELGIGEFARTFRRERMLHVPAGELARRTVGRPMPNAALLGGFAALCHVVSLEAVQAAIHETFSGAVADGNAEAARQAHAAVEAQLKLLKEPTDA
jgi:pyruvate ferredoxin oxidoreductase gamma subunit